MLYIFKNFVNENFNFSFFFNITGPFLTICKESRKNPGNVG